MVLGGGRLVKNLNFIHKTVCATKLLKHASKRIVEKLGGEKIHGIVLTIGVLKFLKCGFPLFLLKLGSSILS